MNTSENNEIKRQELKITELKQKLAAKLNEFSGKQTIIDMMGFLNNKFRLLGLSQEVEYIIA